MIEQLRAEQLRQSRERELDLRFHSARPQRGQPVRASERVSEQRALTAPRLTNDQQRTTRPRPRLREQGVDPVALPLTAQEHEPLLRHPPPRKASNTRYFPGAYPSDNCLRSVA